METAVLLLMLTCPGLDLLDRALLTRQLHATLPPTLPFGLDLESFAGLHEQRLRQAVELLVHKRPTIISTNTD